MALKAEDAKAKAAIQELRAAEFSLMAMKASMVNMSDKEKRAARAEGKKAKAAMKALQEKADAAHAKGLELAEHHAAWKARWHAAMQPIMGL